MQGVYQFPARTRHHPLVIGHIPPIPTLTREFQTVLRGVLIQFQGRAPQTSFEKGGIGAALFVEERFGIARVRFVIRVESVK